MRGSAVVGGAGDKGGGVSGAEAVVDIDDSDVWGAGVEHAEEGRGSGEGGSVADGGGNGEDWDPDEAADDGGEGAFHAGADDDGVGFPGARSGRRVGDGGRRLRRRKGE